jgi:PEP-CTERM motif-containing protein
LKTFARVALVAGLAVSTAAVADTVTIKYDNPIFAVGNINVTITSAGGVGAGEFSATVLSHTGSISDANFVDSKDDFFLYCYDIFQHISAGNTYTYNVNYTGATSRTLDFLGAVNHVLNPGGSDPFAWLHPANGDISGAIQVGIWESLYDLHTDWNLGSGEFTATGLSAGATTEYGLFQAAVLNPSVADIAQSQTMVLTSTDVQDQITGHRGSRFDLPEPGSIALVAVGLLAAGFARRRRS